MDAPRPAGPRPLASPGRRVVQIPRWGEGLPDGMGGYFSAAFPAPCVVDHTATLTQDQTEHPCYESPRLTGSPHQVNNLPRPQPHRALASPEQERHRSNRIGPSPHRAPPKGTSAPPHQSVARQDIAMLREPVENLAYVPGQSARNGGTARGSAFLVRPDKHHSATQGRAILTTSLLPLPLLLSFSTKASSTSCPWPMTDRQVRRTESRILPLATVPRDSGLR